MTVLALKKDVFSTLLSAGISQYLLVPGKQRLRIISVWVTEGEGKRGQNYKQNDLLVECFSSNSVG